MRFRRVLAVFDDAAGARLCDSSGSDHSEEEDPTELFDPVERSSLQSDVMELVRDDQEEMDGFDSDNLLSDSLKKEMLQCLIDVGDDVKRKIRDELEVECRSLENCRPEGLKRRLMTLLRRRGFDAGICKSRWEKTSQRPGGEYEYIDVVVAKSRYVVEVFLAGEFTIARPTSSYQNLIDLLPRIVVLNEYELKHTVRQMCAEMKKSMRIRDMPVPPWRKNGYMQAKWFGPYKRTVNAVPTHSTTVRITRKGSVTVPAEQPSCRGELVRKVGFKSGRTGEVLNGMEL